MGKHMETKRNYLPGEIRKMKVKNSLLTRNMKDLKNKYSVQRFGMIYQLYYRYFFDIFVVGLFENIFVEGKGVQF